MMKLNRAVLICALVVACGRVATAGEVEVLHWWTSEGEVRALNALKQLLIDQGHSWKDFSVEGGGGDKAMTVLRSRVLSGFPPTAAHGKGGHIEEWGKLDVLANLDKISVEQNWPEILPEFVSKLMKYKEHYVAVPVNVHRINWLWANTALFKKIDAKVPSTIEEFWVTAERFKKLGIIPLAHGDQPWQNSILFEMLLLGMTDSIFFKKAFVDYDTSSLSSDKIVQVFKSFRRLRQFMDPEIKNRNWNKATSMVIEGDAAMQVMGDWAKGEFTALNKKLGTDIVCLPSPSTSSVYSYVIDSFIMFKVSDPESKKAQSALAINMLNKEFQQVFNMNKGSIPVRQDIPVDKFDICAQESKKALVSIGKENILPNISIGMATSIYTQEAIAEVVTNFFRNNNVSPEKAAKQLAKVIKESL